MLTKQKWNVSSDWKNNDTEFFYPAHCREDVYSSFYAFLNLSSFAENDMKRSRREDTAKYKGSPTQRPPVGFVRGSLNNDTKTITVNHAQEYENGVYTLNADCKGSKTTFDLVFLRSS